MKHARKDYSSIQDPRGLIPQDEPVFLLRAQDVTAPDVVEYWAFKASCAGAQSNIVSAARVHAKEMRECQQKRHVKVPDMPEE